MSQRVLTFTFNKKKYISKPWNFEAFCRVQDIHTRRRFDSDGKDIGPYTDSIGRIASDAVDYLFEGTEATQDILDTAVSDKMRMCREVFRWYLEDMNAVKNAEAPAEETTAEEK